MRLPGFCVPPRHLDDQRARPPLPPGAGSRPGSPGIVRMVAPGTDIDRVIQRVITRSAVSSAGLKVPHVELTVLSALRGPNPGGFVHSRVRGG